MIGNLGCMRFLNLNRAIGMTMFAGLAASLLMMASPIVRAQDSNKSKTAKKEVADPFPKARIKAPNLDGGLGWLNTAGPIEISKLKGKIVLLDFWTYCCINCMHILPDLAKLEKEFPNELVVIGVHSAKFLGEKDSQNIRDAIQRYGIRHPVVNDGNMEIWNRYGANAWPTQILIDPRGIVIGAASGEGHYEALREAIKKLIDFHKSEGNLDAKPLHFQLESFAAESTPLRYPGKVAIDATKSRLFIADSSHHRVVVANLKSHKVEHVIGSGVMGLKDGDFLAAQFNDPQGIAISGDTIYVADRSNHAIRAVDLKAKSVQTIAGTGQQGYDREAGKPARTTLLASPWDLQLIGRDLYIAMAGTHQIWKIDLDSKIATVFAGTGRENIADGSREESNFAQPSGLSTDGTYLYVADSEVSAVRRIGLTTPVVETLVGRGLFEFGDVDGPGKNARLQHALGVAYRNGIVYVADTYNNKIKTIDAKTGATKTFLGDVKQGKSIDPPRFDEPGGIAVAGDTLYLADTNNHRICTIDIPSKKVSEFKIEGLMPNVAKKDSLPFPTGVAMSVAPQTIATNGPILIQCKLAIPQDQKLNDKAPASYRADVILRNGTQRKLVEGRLTSGKIDESFSIDAISDQADVAALAIAVTYYTCEVGAEGLCRVETRIWNVPIKLDKQGAATLKLP